ncbi:penicillin-binding protein 2 [Candidatus Gracilibacteria bacterium]|nr:penicillin-binding protein 2 [Candidatus Gracilibacteria bacterium]
MFFGFSSRLRVLKFFFTGLFFIFAIRLFDLQVIEYDEFYREARAQHEKRSILPARRGKILVRKNRLTQDVTPVATNNTLKMLFVDPLILAYPKYNSSLDLSEQEKGNPALAAQILAPVLINAHCEKIEGCEIETDMEKMSSGEKIAILAYQQRLEETFLQVERTKVLLESEISESRLAEIEALKLTGIWIAGQSVFVDPTRIFLVEKTAEKLSSLLNIEKKVLIKLLSRRPNRYIEIAHKIVPEVSDKILELKKNPRYKDMLRGIALRNEHWRYYPERSLAAQVLGFVDSQGNGQYGIEGRFQNELNGQSGYIYGATNTQGQRILGENSGIIQAEDGSDILISIDRVIQGQVEKILKEDLMYFEADFGQIIVVEPHTGKILAMANAPSFDPNEFGKAFKRYEITPEQEQLDREDELFNQRIPIIVEESQYYRYFNLWGPQVFRNKLVSDTYEPGSVMKALTMAAALNSDEVTPQTVYNDIGPIEVEEFKIRNADELYAGKTSMITVLNRSLNTGIAFITRKLGKELLYKYLKDFGFGQYTDIELDGEGQGKLEHWHDWSESELITRGFGQGISATPLQMVMGFSALANGGYLMKPLLVEELRHPDGTVDVFEPERIRRVISDKAYSTIKSMLLNSVNNGVAMGGRVYGYSVMGKTGTSQTYKNGKVLEGVGTTITSFAGFGPFSDPKFVVLVKYDYPKTSQWGSETAVITFRKVAKFLFNHFEVPPDK